MFSGFPISDFLIAGMFKMCLHRIIREDAIDVYTTNFT